MSEYKHNHLELGLCFLFILIILITKPLDQKQTLSEPPVKNGLHKDQNGEFQIAKKKFEKGWSGSIYKGISNSLKKELNRLSPGGDTFFMRHPLYLSEVSQTYPKIKKKFQLARISNNYQTKKTLLLEIAVQQSLPTIIRFRALTGISRAAFREGDLALQDQIKYAKKALNLYPSQKSSPWCSDAYYLLARYYGKQHQTQISINNLVNALSLNDSFLEAHWYLIRQLAESFTSEGALPSAKLLYMTSWMLQSLQSINDLTQNMKDFHQLAKSLRSKSHSPFVAFSVGYCYLNAGDFSQAQYFFSKVLKSSRKDPAIQLIVQKSKELMKSEKFEIRLPQ